jgi:hypothetical protein
VCPTQGKEEALMSLTMTIVMLIAGWLAVASAMLWGVLRIARRHHHPVDSTRITSRKAPPRDCALTGQLIKPRPPGRSQPSEGTSRTA